MNKPRYTTSHRETFLSLQQRMAYILQGLQCVTRILERSRADSRAMIERCERALEVDHV